LDLESNLLIFKCNLYRYSKAFDARHAGYVSLEDAVAAFAVAAPSVGPGVVADIFHEVRSFIRSVGGGVATATESQSSAQRRSYYEYESTNSLPFVPSLVLYPPFVVYMVIPVTRSVHYFHQSTSSSQNVHLNWLLRMLRWCEPCVRADVDGDGKVSCEEFAGIFFGRNRPEGNTRTHTNASLAYASCSG
jgi:hypothetical protein